MLHDLDFTDRPLSDAERAHLDARLAAARAESRSALAKTGAVSVGLCGVLAVATLLASDAPRVVVIGFWTILAAGFTVWIGLPWHRLMRQQVTTLDSLRRANRAREIAVRTARVVEFEEVEDEGACYAFDHGEGTLFVIGQEFYEDDDFPNSDFSIIEILNERGLTGDALLVKRGRKLRPERVVPAALKNRLNLPEHLTIVPSPLDRIEEALQWPRA